MTSRRPTRTRPASRRGRSAALTAERHADDDPRASAPRDTVGDVPVSVTGTGDTAGALDTADHATAAAGDDSRPPFGRPVLAELPDLAAALTGLAEADRLQVATVVALARHIDPDEVAMASGVGVEHWVAVTARATRMDRRFLLRLARLLARLPRLCDAAEAGLVSFAQLRGLRLALTGLPPELDATVDDWLAEAARRLADIDADPDALVEQARAALLELTEAAEQEQEDVAAAGRRLVLQPRLDGAGGRFYGEEDAYGFAILDAATAPRSAQLGDPDQARADNLQAWLHHSCDDHADATPVPGTDLPEPADTDQPEPTCTDLPDLTGRGDLPELAALDPDAFVEAHADGDLSGLPGSIRARIAAGHDLRAPKLLTRIDLATLLDQSGVPAEILTRLIGGRLRLTSAAARKVIDQAGAQIRAVVVDDGEVVGVGQATRVPPGWLADAIHAVHTTCTGPLCDRPALGSDLDHAVPWTPDGDTPGGSTDLDNLGPLCASTNRDREATGWTPTQAPGQGMRTWHHERSGLTTTSVPSTWRPPGHRDRIRALLGDPDPPDEPDRDPPPF